MNLPFYSSLKNHHLAKSQHIPPTPKGGALQIIIKRSEVLPLWGLGGYVEKNLFSLFYFFTFTK